jgi:hypothetical protein
MHVFFVVVQIEAVKVDALPVLHLLDPQDLALKKLNGLAGARRHHPFGSFPVRSSLHVHPGVGTMRSAVFAQRETHQRHTISCDALGDGAINGVRAAVDSASVSRRFRMPASVSKNLPGALRQQQVLSNRQAVGRPVEVHAYADRIVIRQDGRQLSTDIVGIAKITVFVTPKRANPIIPLVTHIRVGPRTKLHERPKIICMFVELPDPADNPDRRNSVIPMITDIWNEYLSSRPAVH